MRVKVFQWDNTGSTGCHAQNTAIQDGSRDWALPGAEAEERINQWLEQHDGAIEVLDMTQTSCTCKTLQGATVMGTCLTICYEPCK